MVFYIIYIKSFIINNRIEYINNEIVLFSLCFEDYQTEGFNYYKVVFVGLTKNSKSKSNNKPHRLLT